MNAILMTTILLGAAPTEDELLQDGKEATWVYADADVTRSVSLNLTKEKVGFGQRRTVILQVVSSPRILGGRSLTHAWIGTWSVVPGKKETEIRCLFTRKRETGIDGTLVPSDFFEPVKISFFAGDYGAPKRIPEMKIRFVDPDGDNLWIWKNRESLLFLHAAE